MDAIRPDTSAIHYTDVGSLTRLKDGSDESLKEAARQFESVFVNMWLKSMRQAGSAFSEGNYLSSHAVETHQEMLDHQWSVHLSESGGLGLAEVIEQQLRGEAAPLVRETFNPQPLIDIDAQVVSRANGQSDAAFSDREAFVNELSSIAEEVLSGSGLPVIGLVAQAALETGWGQHVPHSASGASSHNLFGIKAQDGQPQVTVPTKEVEFGRWVDRIDAFRAYPDLKSAVGDWLDLLSGPRYAAIADRVAAVAGDLREEISVFADALQEAGYATDPDYAQKIKDVASTILSRLEMN